MAFVYHCVLMSILYVACIYGEVKKCEGTTLCNNKCATSYLKLKGNEANACEHGCRYFSISYSIASDDAKKISSSASKESHVKEQCYTTCEDAYKVTDVSFSSCKAGCDFEEKIVTDRNLEKSKEAQPHVLEPLWQFRKIVMDIVGGVKVIQTSIVTYFLKDGDQVVSVEVPTQTLVQLSLEQGHEEEPDKKDIAHESVLSRGRAVVERLSLRAGIPPFVIIVSFVSLAILLCYITIVFLSSICKTNKKVTSPHSIAPNVVPVKLVRPEDLTKLSLIDEDEYQAPELPHKVKVSGYTIV